jgi:hypothetical protein
VRGGGPWHEPAAEPVALAAGAYTKNPMTNVYRDPYSAGFRYFSKLKGTKEWYR